MLSTRGEADAAEASVGDNDIRGDERREGKSVFGEVVILVLEDERLENKRMDRRVVDPKGC